MIYGDFDVSGFWVDADYARKHYTEPAPTDEMVAMIGQRLGYTLPRSYVELARVQNGGMPRKTRHRSPERTTWSHDHVAIRGIYSIGHTKRNSLCGSMGHWLSVKEWEYPPIGIYFADCPSAGHDMLCLDYRACGPEGEPQVVHVDQEWEYKITPIAPTFEAFIRGLQPAEAFRPE